MKHKKRPVFDIPYDARGILVSRKNRFLGIVDIINPDTSREEKVHIKDPGRLEDILYPGNEVLLRRADSNPNRKTKWDMIAAKVGDDWILVNSGYHRRIAQWAIENKVIPGLENVEKLIPEQKFGDSRLDFLLEEGEKRTWMEVKGCTLAKNSVAMFPDAPTSRGRRHVEELIKAVEMGYSSIILILVFRPDAQCFAANSEIDPEFASVFEEALERGVVACPLVFSYEDGEVYYSSKIPLHNKKKRTAD